MVASYTATLAGPSGRAGSATTSCGFAFASAMSRRTATVPVTSAVLPPIAEVKRTRYFCPAANDACRMRMAVPAGATFGSNWFMAGGGLSQPQPAWLLSIGETASSAAAMIPMSEVVPNVRMSRLLLPKTLMEDALCKPPSSSVAMTGDFEKVPDRAWLRDTP